MVNAATETLMVRRLTLGAACALISTSCFAHITLETREAPTATTYKAVLRVPHGCAGSPTVAIRIKIPDGVVNVKPMPKPGWTIESKKGKYPKTYEGNEGAKLSEGVLELGWSGGKLPDDNYDEFVFRASSPPICRSASRSISRSCRNVRKAWSAGSKFPPQARVSTITSFLPPS